MLATKKPLQLNSWRVPEVLTGPPFGDTALLDPMAEVRRRQIRWLHLLYNLPSLVGSVHRVVAWRDGGLQEPTMALRAALVDLGWTLRRNQACSRARHWPLVDAELQYPGDVQCVPADAFPLDRAVFTDGSVGQNGGAAVVQVDTDKAMWTQVARPRSSTHCEWWLSVWQWVWILHRS